MTGALVGFAAWLVLPVMGELGDAQRPAVPLAGGAATWSEVSPEREKKAKALVEQGNQALYDSNLRGAAEYYRQALLSWDHPAIHYNLAMALRELGSLIECHKELELAVQHGAPPLSAQKYERAMSIKAAVEGELARLDLKCDEPGARVTIDGRTDLFVCPKVFGEWMLPGQHVVRMTKGGFSHPTEYNLTIEKGQKANIDLRMYSDDKWIEMRTQWPVWAPWAAVGTGVAAAAAGGIFHWQAWRQFRQYDTAITECAQDEGFTPCPPEQTQGLVGYLDQGNTRQNVALAAYIGGGVLLASGVVSLYLNVPRPFPVNPVAGARIAVAPSLGPGTGGVVLSLAF